jgi:hypothetical protein
VPARCHSGPSPPHIHRAPLPPHTSHAPCRIYFQPSRPTSPRKLYIGAGFGRTGTTTTNAVFLGSHFSRTADPTAAGRSIHERHPVTQLANILYTQGGTSLANILDYIEPETLPVALFDIPTGIFVWELMDGFPNHTVILTTRQVGGGVCRSACAWVRAHSSSAGLGGHPCPPACWC